MVTQEAINEVVSRGNELMGRRGWSRGDESAPKDGTQILAEVTLDYFQVVSWWDGKWRENTNGLALRHPFICWHPIPKSNT